MMHFNVALQDVVIAIPVLVGLYTTLYNRKWIWQNKKSIIHVGMLVSTLLSLVTLVVIHVEKANEHERQIVAKRYEVRKEARKKYHPATTITDKECEKPEQMYLPGEWWELYQQLDASSYFNCQFEALEAFTIHYGIDDVPPLPAAGFNLILQEFQAKSNTQTTGHIERCQKILGDYISPFEEPACKPKPKPKSTPKPKPETVICLTP